MAVINVRHVSPHFLSLENPDVRAKVLEDPVGFLKEKHISLDDWLLRVAYPEIRASREVDRQLWILCDLLFYGCPSNTAVI